MYIIPLARLEPVSREPLLLRAGKYYRARAAISDAHFRLTAAIDTMQPLNGWGELCDIAKDGRYSDEFVGIALRNRLSGRT